MMAILFSITLNPIHKPWMKKVRLPKKRKQKNYTGSETHPTSIKEKGPKHHVTPSPVKQEFTS